MNRISSRSECSAAKRRQLSTTPTRRSGTSATRSSAEPAIRIAAVGALGMVLVGATSCGSRCSVVDGYEIELSYSSARPKASDAAVEALLPADEVLGPGRRLEPPVFSFDPNGSFSLSRRVERDVASLPIEVEDLTDDAAWARGIGSARGVVVTRARGAAKSAGLRRRDVIVRVGGRPITDADMFVGVVEALEPKSVVEIELFRDKPLTISIEVESSTIIEDARTMTRELRTMTDLRQSGMDLVELPPDLQSVVLGTAADTQALVVTRLVPRSPAAEADIRLGDLVVAAGGRQIRSTEDYRATIEPVEVGAEIQIEILRDGVILAKRIGRADDVFSEGGFSLGGIIAWHSRPARTKFHLLWGLLFNYRRCYGIHSEYGQEHETHWGMVLDLIDYSGTPLASKLTIGMILPLEFESETSRRGERHGVSVKRRWSDD
jgi:hypothetical protein